MADESGSANRTPGEDWSTDAAHAASSFEHMLNAAQGYADASRVYAAHAFDPDLPKVGEVWVQLAWQFFGQAATTFDRLQAFDYLYAVGLSENATSPLTDNRRREVLEQASYNHGLFGNLLILVARHQPQAGDQAAQAVREQALRQLMLSYNTARSSGNRIMVIQACMNAARANFVAGDYAGQQRWIDTAKAVVREHTPTHHAAYALSVFRLGNAAMKDLAEAQRTMRQSFDKDMSAPVW